MTSELLDQFVIEGRELTQQATEDLLALEATPGDPARLDAAFRALHTLKGSAGMLGFGPMETVLHAAEDLTGAIRAGQRVLSSPAVDALLACIGLVEGWVEDVARSGSLPADAAAQAGVLTVRLGSPAQPIAVAALPASQDWLPALLTRSGATGALTAVRYVPTADCFFRGDDPLEMLRDMPGLLRLDIHAGAAAEPMDPFTCTLVIEALSTATADAIRPLFRLVPDQIEIAAVMLPEPAHAAAPMVAQARSLRVDPARIDRLADIAAELIVAKNQLGHLARAAEANPAGLHRALLTNQADIERLVGELHRAVSAARMVPLGQTLQRLPRLARDTAARLGKAVTLDLHGGDTEAEKRIVDGLFEPLLHSLRNAVDHGIEPPAQRRSAGKPEMGRIVVRAGRENDLVLIEIQDDGPGIDPAAIRRTALAKGLADRETLDALSESALIDLIFAPGFSTAETVSGISGRGVGLDAVRSALAGMGGRVGVTSAAGRGTTVRFTVPQTIVVAALVQVFAAGQSFGIPIEAVLETLRLPEEHIASVRDGAAFARKGVTIPLLRLAALLGMEPAPRRAADAKVVIVRCANDLIGIEVEGFGEHLDVVLRPMSGLLANMPGLLGSALMGDGSVMLVLDLPGLVG